MHFMRKGCYEHYSNLGCNAIWPATDLTCVMEKYCIHLQRFRDCDGTFISVNIYHNTQHHTPQNIPTAVGTRSFVLYNVQHTRDIQKN